ncbi:hypothetical protein LTR36_001456 [Oleoguttula mirabilis]|uniref:UBC core domain-containing protein n=1 Tax=Oleoguttula mirabilis TaxID=1507867 RepID=A0AAV9J2T0_9PEZI|nr:hypothetical protein LTR36_001456 [Oleoguttula mirabilis]
MDLNDLRRKRMRLFASTDADDDISPQLAPPTYSTGPPVGATAAAPIDLTAPNPPAAATPMDGNTAAQVPVAEDVDVSNEATEIRAFVRKTLKTKCACCGEKITLGPTELVRQFTSQIKMSRKNTTTVSALKDTDDEYGLTFPLGIELNCPKCREATCIGCGHSKKSCTDLHEAQGNSLRIIWHCDTARVAHIWLLLCGYDTQVKHNKPHLRKPRPADRRKKRKHGRGSGIGYSGDYYDGGEGFNETLANFHTALSSGVFTGAGHTLDDVPAAQNPDVYKKGPLPSQFAKGVKEALPSISSFAPSAQNHDAFYGFGQTLGGEEPTDLDKVDASHHDPMYKFPTDDFATDKFLSTTKPGSSSVKSPFYQEKMRNAMSHYFGLMPSDEESDNDNDEDDLDMDVVEDDLQSSHLTSTGKFGGYGAHKLGKRSTKLNQEKRPKKPMRVDPDDDITAKVMAAITLLLPSTERVMPSAMDNKPPHVLFSMLLRSSLTDKAAELLRNDSLDNLTQRGGLYESTLNFVRALTTHEATCKAVVDAHRLINRAGHDLLKVSAGKPTRMQNEKMETSSPLGVCLHSRYLAAQTLTVQANAYETEFRSDESQQLLFLCHNVCEIVHIMEAHPSEIGEDKPGKKSVSFAPDVAPREVVDAWHKELGVVEVPDDVIFNNSFYDKKSSEMVDPPTGRMRSLIKELTILKTGLPPGIFVRYGSSRLDCMKVLIVGPKGTPYENGLWEFDLCCDINFPNKPPYMTFRTTGGGSVTVNPNLYNDGKVCLSLLGTWEGERWQPGVSTLLQVLVSIQAMIFCDEPYCNEPVQAGLAGTDASKAYNRAIYPWTVRYAMLEWLEQGAGIWGDVVTKHFEEHGEEIITRVGGWIKEKAGARTSSAAAFAGTGWGGKTLGDGSGATVSAGSFVGKLKGALSQLE